jgi:outer membrane protein OmpA-like peptidoglycan-associated protein
MKSVAVVILALLFLSHPAQAQSDQPLSLECTRPEVVKSDVRSVTEGKPHSLITTPVNQLGEHIPDLGPADFRIAKGRKIATIHEVKEITAVENTVMRVILMVDNSQSMSPWLGIMHRTLDKTIAGLSPAVRVAVLFFREGENAAPSFHHNGRPLPIVRLPYTYDKPRAAEYAKRMLVERNLTRNTYLYDGVYAVREQIDADTGRVDRSFAIIFSDGEDNKSIVDAATALNAAHTGTTYFTIDYLTKANSFLVELARNTGGEHFLARNAEDLGGIFDEIAKKIVAKGYTVTYSFKSPPSATIAASASELVMEEEIIRETFPLLNYVFFEQASSTIPERYTRLTSAEVSAFDESAIEGDALDFYYNALNVIGSRMNALPAARITVTGYHNNTGSERNASQLAKGRAEAVRDYLRTVWNIADARMTITSGALPPVASSSRDTMGQSENRRVEITTDEAQLLRPVTFVRRIASVIPETVQFTTAVNAEEGLESWRISTEQNGTLFDQRTGSQHEARISWNWKNRTGGLPASSGTLSTRFLVQDRAGDSYVTEPVSITVREVKRESRKNVMVEGGITVEKISLILFPFDVAEPGPRNESIMNEYVYPRVTDEARITVSGYTDVIGSDDYNLKLSQQRADAVRTVLLARLGQDAAARVNAVGLGETSPVFSNDTPEGRFYNRTVSLRIER